MQFIALQQDILTRTDLALATNFQQTTKGIPECCRSGFTHGQARCTLC
jgi:hypothetical protein